jgi:hypothetical protein
MIVIDHLLLGVAALAVGGASFRLASTLAHPGLERVLVAAPIFAATIVVETLALGLFGLGGSQIPLLLAAVLTWALAAAVLPRPSTTPREDLAHWLRQAPTPAIACVSALIGIGGVWAAWSLWAPNVGVDGVYYHLPQIVRWVHGGSPGSVDQISYLFPVGTYPLTNAVAQAWGLGISRSMVMVSVWPIFNMAVLILAGWIGLRRLAIPVPLRLLAVAAVATTPVVLLEMGTPLNDLPALSWLACGAALTVCSRGEPRYLIPAVVAIGLAIGTKTIALPLGIALLFLALAWNRHGLRSIARPLGIAFGVFAVVGCFWYVRNFIDHGSPFWPWSSSPWGDPVPEFLRRYESFLDNPLFTLEGQVTRYLTFLGGAVVLLLGALASAAARADRAARLSGALLAGLLLLWAAAPSTARDPNPVWDGSVSQTRYLLPTIGFAAVVICVASRRHRRLEQIGIGLLSIALVWNLAQLFTGAFPAAPSHVLTGALAGLAIGTLVANSLRDRLPLPGRSIGAALAVVSAGLLAVPAANWVANHGEKHPANFDARLATFLASRDDFNEGNQPIRMAPLLAGPLAGDRLQHNLELIPATAPCSDVARLRNDGWVILFEDEGGHWTRASGYSLGECLKDESPLAVIDGFRIYQPSELVD